MPQLLRCPQPAPTDPAQLYELLVAELTDSAVFLTDPTGCVVSWNPGVERLLGYAEADWLGQPAHVIFTPEDRAAGAPEQEMSKAAREGRAPDIRWHQRQDGSRLYVEGTMVALKDSTGQLLGFSKVMRDITERKRTEEQLRAALAYADSIIATVRTPMLVLDGALRIRSANRTFYRAFQVSPTETEDRLLYELGNRQWDIPRLRMLLEEVLPQNATVEDFEVEHVFPVLGRRVMLLNARQLWREGNHTELVLLALEDITERKEAEEALRASEARHGFLLTLSDALRPLSDPEAIKVAACRVLAERLRAHRAFYAAVEGDDWVVEGGYGQGVAPLPPGRYGAGTYGRRIMETYRAGRAIVFRDTRSDPGFAPEEREAHVAIDILGAVGVPLMKEEKLVAILTVHTAAPRDWTEDDLALVQETAERTWAAVEHAHAEAALRHSEERLRRALEIDTVGVIFFDLDGNIHRSNEAFLRLSGYTREEFPLRWDQLTPPEWMQDSLQTAHQLATTGRATPYEKEYVRADGSRWWGLFAPRMLNECEAVEFILDITTRKQAAEELQQKNQELARSNRSLEEFAYVASHDLQEPLRTVHSYEQLLALQVGTEWTDEQRDFLGYIQQGAKRMEQLIHDLLAYSRTAHLAGELGVSPASLDDALRQALMAVEARVAEAGAVITHDALPVVRGNVTQLAHVLQNLLSNALKYRKPDLPPQIHIGALRQDTQWVIAVRDNGIGFAPQHATRIFGLFKRLHRDEYPGTGVGLAICQRLVERYGGRMWAEGRPGEGATFCFSLPRVEGP